MALWPSCVLVLLAVSTQAQGAADVLDIIPESQTFHCLNISSIEICSQIGYSMGLFPNWREQNSVQVANQELNNYLPIIQRVCSEAIVHLLCGVYAPFCEPARPFIRLPPCQELCDYVRAGCEDDLMEFGFVWPPALGCDRYPTRAETRLSYCPSNVTDLRIPPNIQVNRPLVCPAVPPLDNGVITYAPDNTPDFDLGTVATHVCNEGYVLEGVMTRTCGGDGSSVTGMWSDKPPICVPIQCPALPPVDNGMVDYNRPDSDNYDIGTVASYTCNEGFSALANVSRSRTCELTSGTTAEWTGEVETWGCISTSTVISDQIIAGSVLGGLGLVLLLISAILIVWIKRRRYEQEEVHVDEHNTYDDPNVSTVQPPLPMCNVPMATSRALDHDECELTENKASEMEREPAAPTLSTENGHSTDPVEEAESSNRTCDNVLEVPDNCNPIMTVSPPTITDESESCVDPGDMEGSESSTKLHES